MPEALAEAANLVVRPLHPVFGAEVTVRDRAGSAATVAAEIERCLATAGLVVIRDVALDDAGLARFAGHFGPLQDLAPGAEPPGIFHVTNLDEHGNLRAADDPSRLRHEANKLWHVDSSFIAPGVTYSFLHARIVPEADKDT
ncbi:MAG: TauD/TfdA family dioxygenase, partial [Novosphingobium sp.]|nr:TauD/TfdA family dioxygenase [Novosphingobium sp.]